MVFLFSFPVHAAVVQVITAVCVGVVRNLLLGEQIETGWTKLYSTSFLRCILASKLYESSFLTGWNVVSRFTSRFIHGAKYDVRCNFTPQPEEPLLTSFGRNVFAANGVKMRNKSFHPGGVVRFGRVDVGDATMILDRSLVAPGTSIHSNVLVGSITAMTRTTEHSPGSLLMGIPAMQLIRMTHANQDKTSITHNTLVQSTLQYFIELYFFLILVEVPISIALYSNICIHWLVEQSHSITFRVLLFTLPTSMVLLVTWLLGIVSW